MSEFVSHPVDSLKHGNKRTRFLVIGSGIALAGALAWRFRQSQNADDAADDTATADANALDAGTTDDGTYGYTDDSGYGSSTPIASEYGYTNPQGDTITNGSTETVSGPSTNAAWTQEVVSYLSAQGYDSDTVLAALGAYMAGHGLTSAQYAIVEAGLAAEGHPPTNYRAPVHAANGGQNQPHHPVKDNPHKPAKPQPGHGKQTAGGSRTRHHDTGKHNSGRSGRKPITRGGGKVAHQKASPPKYDGPSHTKHNPPKRKVHR